MHAIVIGPDEYDIAGATATAGHDVGEVDVGNRDALEAAGVEDAAVLVLTEVEQATAIPVARELNPDLRVVVYDDDTLPDFARGQADLLLDPALFDPAEVAAELDS
jgi:hypothetical protein